MRWRNTAAAALLIALAGPAWAQGTACRVPEIGALAPLPFPASLRSTPGPVRGYTLALSWSPQYCRGVKGYEEQCDKRVGRFGFILHGLWPEGANGRQLAWCRPATVVPAEVARASFCATPSRKLLAHEWAKHGTCATDTPGDYYAAARKLFAFVVVPDMGELSRRPRLDVAAFKRAIAAVNPTIAPSAIKVTTERRGDWLREVRICLDADLRPEPCARAGGMGAPDNARVRIWRGNAV